MMHCSVIPKLAKTTQYPKSSFPRLAWRIMEVTLIIITHLTSPTKMENTHTHTRAWPLGRPLQCFWTHHPRFERSHTMPYAPVRPRLCRISERGAGVSTSVGGLVGDCFDAGSELLRVGFPSMMWLGDYRGSLLH